MTTVLATHEPEATRLPALIDRASQRLTDARTSAEVLEAKAIAESALHFAKVTRAANETHADCLRIIVRAEMRMATEIDAGQARGEVATREANLRHGSDVRESDIGPATLDELGVSRQRLSEWRETRDAGEEIVEIAIQEALAEGRPPTKADVRRAIENVPHVAHNSGNNEWYTPADYIKAAREALGRIDLDPASSEEANRVVKASRIFTADDDGLSQAWSGRVWLNPPYAQPLVSQFCEKVAQHAEAGDIDAAIVLVNNATETQWFRRLVSVAAMICHPTGRVKFWSPTKESAAPLQGQAIVYVGQNPRAFTEAFASFGYIVSVVRR